MAEKSSHNNLAPLSSNIYPCPALHDAVKRGDIEDLKELILHSPLDEPNTRQQTALHIAAQYNQIKPLQILLKCGANPNAQDHNGWTPLHCSSNAGHLELCEILLKHDSTRADIVNCDGTSPLHYLVRIEIDGTTEKQIKLFKTVFDLMITRNARIDQITFLGESPLHQACNKGNVTAVNLLLINKAPTNVRNNYGETPLDCATRGKHSAVVNLITKHVKPITGIGAFNGPSSPASASPPSSGSSQAISPHPSGLSQAQESPRRVVPKLSILDKISSFGSSGSHNGVAKPSNGSAHNTPRSLRGRSKKNMDTSSSSSSSSKEENGYPNIIGKTLFIEVKKATVKTTLNQEVSELRFAVKMNKLEFFTSFQNTSSSLRWGQEFFFEISSLSHPIKISLRDRQNQSLASLRLPLEELMFLSPLKRKMDYTLKKRKGHITCCKLTLILRAESTADLSLTNRRRKKKRNSTPSLNVETEFSPSISPRGSNASNRSTSHSPTSSNIAFGKRRGKCQRKDCDCELYISTSDFASPRAGRCLNCGHYPAKHENLGDQACNPLVGEDEASKSGTSAFKSKMMGFSPREDYSHPFTHSWEIDSKELILFECIGQGASAKVFRGKFRNQDVAIKLFKDDRDKSQEEFQKEFAILSSLRSVNMGFFYGACMEPFKCMVLEYCPGGSLYDVLSQKNLTIDWPIFFKIAIGAARGIHYLHSWKPEILHRDIKSLNFLIGENWTVKVSDLGLSRFNIQNHISTLSKARGTYAYLAPEVYFTRPFTAKSDVYSLGIVLWELIVRTVTGSYERPYQDYPQFMYDFQIIIQTAKKGLRPSIPHLCPAPLLALLQRCWDHCPENRPASSQVLETLLTIQALHDREPSAWPVLRKNGSSKK
eukprot:TRINITY_DN2591_c0_g1_i1.p1 TRINITY_DN2591_c0_g1~~TRINITY_DN2591_c0_g1_i1.p1  ORF type:complete len:882 (+),score=166.67 TRINITY_DN2591_c0_g1_i1:189-2834(+)